MHPFHALETLPQFLLYLACAIGLTLLYTLVYISITPHAEFKLIRSGNLSASIAFGGSLLGFVLPLASTIAHAVDLVDMCIWGLVALSVQILSFFVARFLIPGLPAKIEADDRAAAVFSGAFFLAAGVLNAACLTW